jgi:coenzyme PQQ synthesis protein D (PqqD)
VPASLGEGWPTPESSPQRRPGVSAVALDDNVALYDDVDQVLILLNPSAAAVWDGCDGTCTLDELVGRLAEAHGEDRGVVGQDVGQTVRKLAELGLLSEAGAPARG